MAVDSGSRNVNNNAARHTGVVPELDAGHRQVPADDLQIAHQHACADNRAANDSPV